MPIGALIRKQFIVFPVEAPLSQILANLQARVIANKSCVTGIWVKSSAVALAGYSYCLWIHRLKMLLDLAKLEPRSNNRSAPVVRIKSIMI